MIKPSALLSPLWLILIPVLASFAVWAVPGQSLLLRGFDQRAALDPGGVALLLGWYAAVVLIALLGVAIGGSLPLAERVVRAEATDDYRRIAYVVMTVVAVIGVVGTYVMIAGEHSILDELAGGTANVLTQDLQAGSSIATLRYATIAAAPLGFFLWLQHRRSVPLLLLAILNITLLGANAILSSRLSLLMAIVVFGVILFLAKPDSRLRLLPLGILVVVVGALLTGFNYVRNYNFYENLGISNPIEMNFYQLASYAGAPTQVAIGVADGIVAGRYAGPSDVVSALDVLIPTFLRDSEGRSDRAGQVDPSSYGYQVDIAPNLNANSVFAEVFSRYGWWGLAFVLVAVLVAAIGFGYFRRYGPVLAVAAGALAYTFVDFWRSYLLNTGIVIFVVLLAIAAAAAGLCAPRIRTTSAGVARRRRTQ